MTTKELLKMCHKGYIQLDLNGDKIHYRLPNSIPEVFKTHILEAVRSNKVELIHLLKSKIKGNKQNFSEPSLPSKTVPWVNQISGKIISLKNDLLKHPLTHLWPDEYVKKFKQDGRNFFAYDPLIFFSSSEIKKMLDEK